MYDKLIAQLIKENAKKVIYFISEKEIVRVVRTSYHYNGKFDNSKLELTVTRGKPNFAEREIAHKMGKTVKGSTWYKYLPKKKKPARSQKK